jgi:hypothetical protein
MKPEGSLTCSEQSATAPYLSQSQNYFAYSQSSRLGDEPLQTHNIVILLSNWSLAVTFLMQRTLWRKERSVVNNCCWPSPAQSFLGPSPTGPMTTFTVSDSRLPQPGRPDPRIYILQEQGAPVMPLGTGFPFRRLLRPAELRWRYSTPPPYGLLVFAPYLKVQNLF